MSNDIKLTSVFQIDAYRHRYKSQVGGLYFGFESLDPYLQFVQGIPIVFTGVANMGKTNFIKELLINLSIIQGKKHFVFSPEGAGKLALVNELISMYISKESRVQQRIKIIGEEKKTNEYSATDEQWKQGADFVEQYFYIAERDDFPNPKQVTLQDVYNLEKLTGIFDTVTIDAFNQLHDPNDSSLYKFVIETNQAIKAHDEQENKSTFIVVHGQEVEHRGQTGASPYPMPVASKNLEGGKGWEKFADVICQVYVPQKDTIETEYDYPALIMIQKVRSKDSGKKGVVTMGWSPQKMARYYEIIDGRIYYADEYRKEQINGKSKDYNYEGLNADTPF